MARNKDTSRRHAELKATFINNHNINNTSRRTHPHSSEMTGVGTHSKRVRHRPLHIILKHDNLGHTHSWLDTARDLCPRPLKGKSELSSVGDKVSAVRPDSDCSRPNHLQQHRWLVKPQSYIYVHAHLTARRCSYDILGDATFGYMRLQALEAK